MYNYHHNLVTAKPGSTVLAHVESFSFVDHPGFVEWELRDNRARVWSITGEILGPSSEPGQIHTMCARGNPWEYTLDFGGNLMIYLDKRPVPQDLELVHKLRKTMFDATTRKHLLIGLLEFADSFGANTVGINNKLDELNTIVADVMPAYFELRFEEVLESYEEIVARLGQLELEAIELKDRALLWVYIIEWLSVTGTAMVAGVLLWTIMVRRRLYREVGTTRMVASDS
jgi:hypothetical protein